MRLAILKMLLIITRLSSSSYCSKELKYYEEYDGYGSDVKCNNLVNADVNLMRLSSYKPVCLQIQNASITEVKPIMLSNVKTIRILKIANSTFLLNTTANPFEDLQHLEQLLIENSTIGSISETTFQTLEFLTVLRLHDIKLSQLPKNSLKNLQNLRTLDLSMNKFSTASAIQLCEVSHVKKINLERNQISSLSSSSFICDNLRESIDFDLNAFKYEVTIPEPVIYHTLRPKTYLVDINLSHNKIKLLSSAFSEINTLKYLNLEGNMIDVLHDYEFSSLENLRKLNLKSNFLTSINETVFSNIMKIEEVILENNRLVHVTVLGLPSLRYINLASNQFLVTNIENWKKLPKLENLDLSHNNIKQLPPSIFKSIETIKYLNVSHNILNLENDTFKFLNGLIHLNLRSNNLTSLPSGIFKNLFKLEKLDLSGNLIRDLNFTNIFEDQLNLVNLNLSYNKLENVDKRLFKSLKNLKLLDIEGNYLKRIDVDIISGLPYLRITNIRNNKFSCEFLTDLLKFLKKKQIIYTAEKELTVTAENVGGIPCVESKKTLATTKTTTHPQRVTSSDYRVGDKQNKTSVSTVFSVTFSVLVILCLVGYVIYRYYKRKKYISEQFELIGD